MAIFKALDELPNETGLVFGNLLTPYLRVAMQYATLENVGSMRRTAIITAANPSALKAEPASRWADGVAYIRYHADFDALMNQLENEPNKPEALVFHDIGAYSRYVMETIVGSASPEQSHWGVMARIVRNDFLRLTAIVPVIYATVDVTKDEKTKELDLNLSPYLQKSIIGDFGLLAYVTQAGDETLVQTDRVSALKFRGARSANAEAEAASQPAKKFKLKGNK